MKGKKILVIVIIIVAVLAVAGTVFGYLFLKTDLLKVFFPNGFTLPELQKIYESILNKKLDRRNFRKKMLNTNIIIATEEEMTFEGKKKAKIYKFK